MDLVFISYNPYPNGDARPDYLFHPSKRDRVWWMQSFASGLMRNSVLVFSQVNWSLRTPLGLMAHNRLDLRLLPLNPYLRLIRNAFAATPPSSLHHYVTICLKPNMLAVWVLIWISVRVYSLLFQEILNTNIKYKDLICR